MRRAERPASPFRHRRQRTRRASAASRIRALRASSSGGSRPGETLRQHALAGTGRADQQQAVTAGGRDLERALRRQPARGRRRDPAPTCAHARQRAAGAKSSPAPAVAGHCRPSVRSAAPATRAPRATRASSAFGSGTTSCRLSRTACTAAASAPRTGAQFSRQRQFAVELDVRPAPAQAAVRRRPGCRARSRGRSARLPSAGPRARG